MTTELEQRAKGFLPKHWSNGFRDWSDEQRREYAEEYAIEAVVAALQAQQPDDKLADTQRAIIEAAEARGYRRGIAEAQQPAFTTPQPPSIPEPSDADVDAAMQNYYASFQCGKEPGVYYFEETRKAAMRAAITTYTARLRERLK